MARKYSATLHTKKTVEHAEGERARRHQANKEAAGRRPRPPPGNWLVLNPDGAAATALCHTPLARRVSTTTLPPRTTMPPWPGRR